MKLKIFSCLSAQRRALGPAPAGTDVFEIVDPACLPEFPSAWANDLQSLAAQYQAWRDSVAEYDFVGFENAACPFFVDPMQRRRLEMHFPELLALREQSLQSRNAAELAISPAVFATYEQSRAAFDDADVARLRRWAGRIGIATPPASPADPLRARHTDQAWAACLPLLRKFPAFSATPEAILTLGHWPRRNSMIMRSELFAEFATILFETLDAFLNGKPAPNPRFAEFLAERLLGVFIEACLHADPLLVTAELPLLRAVPAQAPAEPPAGFNAAAYVLINLDIAPGTPAREHYLSTGWRDGREWDLQ